jgi:rare lipoprotein A
MTLLRCLALLLIMTGCAPQGPSVTPHYVVGQAYQAAGIWYYPQESFDYDETGLAAVVPGNSGFALFAKPRLTADGEVFDESALAAAHPTLQLPAIARITNLENGRQVVVRINDRGTPSPDRVIQVTRRTAELLAAADPQAIRVRVQILDGDSRTLALSLQTDAPHAAVATAPTGDVQSQSLAPPPGAHLGAGAQVAAMPHATAPTGQAAAAVPLRLPEAVTVVPVRQTSLAIDCGDFSDQRAAEVLRARLQQLGARTTTSYGAQRDAAFGVRIGPLASVAAAEAMRRRATAAGATDARIVVE